MRSKGITAFIFEKGMPGFMPGKKEDKLGLRASETASVIFEDCRVPDENRLGPEGLGFIQAMQILDGGRISIAALALGIAQGAYESALRYSKERQQFGQPISNFQAIQFKLADMATQIEAARLLTYRAAWLKDQGHPFSREASMAKVLDALESGAPVKAGSQIGRQTSCPEGGPTSLKKMTERNYDYRPMWAEAGEGA